MIRRDRLRGHRFSPAKGVTAEVRRSCRRELKVIYEGPPFGAAAWAAFRALGEVSVYRASQFHPAMKDLFRMQSSYLLLEGAGEARVVTALFRSRGKARARHQLEAILCELYGKE